MDDIRWCICARACTPFVGTTGMTQEDLAGGRRSCRTRATNQRDRGCELRARRRARCSDSPLQSRPVPARGRDHRTPSRTEGGRPSGTAGRNGPHASGGARRGVAGPAGRVARGRCAAATSGRHPGALRLRLPGAGGAPEVIFGGRGRRSRSGTTRPTGPRSCPASSLMAARAVMVRPGLTIGLEPLLDLPPLP